MNTVGFDAATIGNHEFNYGLDFMLHALDGAAFPTVLANIGKSLGAGPRDDATLLPPYVLLDRILTDGAGQPQPIRIGLIGFVPPQVMMWDQKLLHGRVAARDIVASAAAWVPELREAGADLVVVLSHSGIGPAVAVEGMENASVPLAALPGIDVVMTGHSHLVFPSPAFAGLPGVDAAAGRISGKPAVMAGFWGSHVGAIDLLLEREGGQWRVCDSASAAHPIARRNADFSVSPQVASRPDVLAAAADDHARTLAYVRRPVGRTTTPLYSYFAMVADDPSVQLVAAAQAWYMAEMLRGTPYAALPMLSAAAPFKAGGRGGPEYFTDVPAGDLALRNIADLYMYPNTIRAVLARGAEVQDWLERSAGLYHRVTPGLPDQLLLNPDFPSYNFDMLKGVTYQIDLSQPARFDAAGRLADSGARRIRNLCWNGAPIDPAAQFVVATNNYRATGGGDFAGARGDSIIFEGPDTNRDVVVRYIKAQGTISPRADGNWRFAPLPGTSVVFDTGPRAAAYLGDVKTLQIEPAGDGPGGFARFRIRL